jgi:hypothetical protein
VNFTDWAQAKIPHLSEVSNSNPDATLRRHNLVAVTDDLETARVLALDFERSTSADFDTTMLVLGHAVDRAPPMRSTRKVSSATRRAAHCSAESPAPSSSRSSSGSACG